MESACICRSRSSRQTGYSVRQSKLFLWILTGMIEQLPWIQSTDDTMTLNEALVRQGFAWVYRKYCKADFCTDWLEVERGAKGSGLGLWGDINAVPPWEFRRRKWGGGGDLGNRLIVLRYQGQAVFRGLYFHSTLGNAADHTPDGNSPAPWPPYDRCHRCQTF